MRLRRIFFLLVSVLLVARRVLGAQDAPMTRKEFHDRIVGLLKRIAAHPLPSGDTSVTWRRTPILYHTVARSDTLVRSGFVRNDGLTGLASVAWRGSTPTKFDVSWIQGDSTLTSLSGVVEGSTLNVAGSRKGRFALPSIPWAIGDYGMDEQLVILMQHLPIDSSQRIAVFRPFGFKWDTVTVRVTRGPEGTLRVAEPERTDTTRWVISNTGDLLQLTRDTTIVERRPLEETGLYALYRRVRIIPPDLR